MKALGIIFLVAASVPALAQPPVSGPQTVALGKTLYDRHCTACHGANGGAGDRAPAIVSAATSMRGARSDAQLMAVVKNGIPGTAMPAWGNRLSDGDIAALGAYFRALRGTALDNPLPGDVVQGEALFWGKGGCGSCHAISGRGGVIGPDLGNIAAERKSNAISDALTKSEHRVFGDGGVHQPSPPPMEYESVRVVTKSGQAIDGVMRNQDAWSVQFIGMDSKLYSFDRGALRSVTIKPGGVMPTDYDKRLSPDEFQNLLAFLTRQGSKPSAAAPRGEE